MLCNNFDKQKVIDFGMDILHWLVWDMATVWTHLVAVHVITCV